MQEGLALETTQLAGTHQLNNLIIIQDYNNVQINSRSNEVNNTNTIKYFESQNFHAINVVTFKLQDILNAIKETKTINQPVFIRVHTKIARHTKYEDSLFGHHNALNEDETMPFKHDMGLKSVAPFEYEKDIYNYCKELMKKRMMNMHYGYKK